MKLNWSIRFSKPNETKPINFLTTTERHVMMHKNSAQQKVSPSKQASKQAYLFL